MTCVKGLTQVDANSRNDSPQYVTSEAVRGWSPTQDRRRVSDVDEGTLVSGRSSAVFMDMPTIESTPANGMLRDKRVAESRPPYAVRIPISGDSRCRGSSWAHMAGTLLDDGATLSSPRRRR